MKKKPNNETCRTSGPKATVQILAATFALGAMLVCPALAENFLPATGPGGIQVRPTNWFTITSNSPTLNFSGLESPYMIQVTTNGGVSWDNAGITSLKYPNHTGSVTLTNPGLYRMMMLGGTNWVGKWHPDSLAISNVFVSSGKCIGCHSDKVTSWGGTAHATALSLIMDTNSGAFIGFANASCVPCHTVGNGQPGGFTSLAATPQLANVQCENCHGSANAHVNISGRTYHPVNTLASETCGGCHSGSHHPTYEEWSTSPHAEVVPDVGYGIGEGAGTVYQDTVTAVLTNATTGLPYSAVLNGYVVTTNGITNVLSGMVNSTNDFAGLGRQMTCGFCHSGATRLAMLNDYDARKTGVTNFLALPDKWVAAETPQTCATCHDPHGDYNDAQLRNPMNSTNYYTMFTGSSIAVTNRYTNVLGQASITVSYKSDGFASQYDPNVNVCAQCHNTRGARWDGRSKSWNVASNAMVLGASQSFTRGPHQSPQYNILIGIVQDDYLNLNAQGVAMNFSASHSGIMNRTPYNTNQCATCHMASYAVSSTTNVTGHTYVLATNNCTICHGSVPNYVSTQITTSNRIAYTVTMLNQWATTYGPAIFGTNYSNYLQNGWEYGTLGGLATITNAGPTGSDANKVPDAIKQARFNLYMVQFDGSLGVHNPGFLTYLLNDASNKVNAVMAGATNSAYFIASATKGYTPFAVTFTAGGTGITNYSWNFGDGGTSTKANPTYVYNNRGSNTVTLTTIAGGVTTTYTRSNYIGAYTQPNVAFSASPTIGQTNLTVTFTNLSTATADVTLWRWTVKNGPTTYVTNIPPALFATYTYTTPGTNSISLRAVTPAGNVTFTTNNYIIATP